MRLVPAFLLVTLLATNISAQETKKKTVEVRDSQFKEVYYVLKADEQIKHGLYNKTYGRFKAKGQYDNNVRTGIWEYTFEDELKHRIDFTNDTVLFTKPYRALAKSWLIIGDSLLEDQTKKPIYLGGDSRMMYHVLRTLRYPEDARRRGIEGTVYISAIITPEGEMKEARLEDGPKGGGLSVEALRVIQNIPQEWIPPFVNGEPVASKVIVQLKFQMPK